jgi:phosphoribosylaminoimidazole (AIR) synthetase
MGVGFVIAVDAQDMPQALEQLPGAFVLGEVVPRPVESDRVVWATGDR